MLFDDRAVVLRLLDCPLDERRLVALFFFAGAGGGIRRLVVYAYCTNSGDPCSLERAEVAETFLGGERGALLAALSDCVT